MLFTEPTFLFLFLPVLLALYFAPASSTHGRYGNWLLLVASVIFYAKGGGRFTWLMLASIAFNYFMAILVAARRSQGWLAFAIGANLTVLGIFKYANFLADNINTLFLVIGVPPLVVPRVLLPIGISFFTFHAISYVVDVYRPDATAQESPVHACGIRRFVIGLAKKVLIANVVAGPADQIFAMPFAQLSIGHAWLGLVCYTLQIYFDFSGYSDMAIGLGRMFGFRFPENFRWPYIADTVQEFWRRWHISLSTWFRDYLYVPLGGNRVPPSRMYRNLVTVFFLCGLWHGASWNFVIWGLWHGTFLVIERVLGWQSARTLDPAVPSPPPAQRAAGHVYALSVVMVGWVFFRAETLAGSLAFLRALAGLSPALTTPYTVSWYFTPEVALALAAGVIGSMPWVPALAARIQSAPRRPGIAWTIPALNTTTLALLLLASIMQMAARTYNPFIYFRF